jgi:phospholipid-binding lipoprotein MlaA
MTLIVPIFILFAFLLTSTHTYANPSLPEPDTSSIQNQEGATPIGDQTQPDSKEAVRELASNEKDLAEEEGEEEDLTEEEEVEEEVVYIADPLSPWNTAMFYFNDKFYFWVLKPVTQVYSHIIPEDFRILIKNFYQNIETPIRFVNCLLQLKFKDAGNELVRFVFNTFAGVGGLGDVAKDALGIKMYDADFGQTLGKYGIGHGFYIVWPILGPASLRDSVGFVGDRFLDPLSSSSISPMSDISWEVATGIYAHEGVNKTSFWIGDYEAFKEAAIDPYVSMRDAYAQKRKKAVEESNP